MAFPSQVLSDITTGKDYLADLVEQYQAKFYTGGCNCDIETMYMLTSIMKDLEYKSSIGYFDSVSQGLYAKMMEIIGGEAYLQVAPVVDAGADKSALTSEPQTFNAVITEGTYPIATILWTQESGTAATLSGQNTANLTVSNFAMGYSVFKVTVTDTEGNSDSDTVELEGLSVEATIEFGYTASNPYGSEDEVVLQFEKQVELGATEYELEFTNAANLQYLVIKEPVGEPIKTIWINKAVFNEGVIPDSKMRLGVVIGSFRYYISRVPFALDAEISSITLKTV